MVITTPPRPPPAGFQQKERKSNPHLKCISKKGVEPLLARHFEDKKKNFLKAYCILNYFNLIKEIKPVPYICKNVYF